MKYRTRPSGTNIDGTAYTAYVSGGVAKKIYEITTPYLEADLDTLKFTQSADVMTITHPSYAPRELSRTDHDAWTLAEINFGPEQDHPDGLTATQNGTTGSETYKYRVTAIKDETFEESLPAVNNASATITGATAADPVVITATSHGFANGEEVEINNVAGMTEINGRRFTVANQTTNTFELKDEDGSGYTAYTSGGDARLTFAKVTNGNATLTATNNISVSWTEESGAQRYAVYKEDNGLYGLLGETEETSYVDDGTKSPDLESGPPRLREPFRLADDRPAAPGYYQQRRVFGGSNNLPDTSDYSRTGDQANFAVSTPSKADDAIRATLTSQEVNQIRHYVPLDDLLIFTAGEEWRINAGGEARFSNDTINQDPQTRWGCSHRRPITVGRIVLFVQENNHVVRSIGFELATDGYTGTDMTLLASHIFEDEDIKEWAYARSPGTLVYVVRDDGKAAVLTFNQEQEVIGWTRWGTRSPDKFDTVATVRPSATDRDDQAYFVVRRTINGTSVRYIERTDDRRFTDVKDCFFVDSGKTFDSPIAISAATQASPVVLTVPSGHGLAANDEVDISDITWVPDVDTNDTESQPMQLNGGRFKVKVATATNISLKDLDDVDVDGTAFNAYVEGGNIRKAVTTLLGFHHLAGETVRILADGSVEADVTVSSTGSITLPRKFSRVHAGFGYYADVELLDIEDPGPSTIQGRHRRVAQVVIRVVKSRGMWVGGGADDMADLELVEWKQREDELYGEATALFTGDVEIDILPEWNSHGRVLIRQRDPLPLTIVAMAPKFELDDDAD